MQWDFNVCGEAEISCLNIPIGTVFEEIKSVRKIVLFHRVYSEVHVTGGLCCACVSTPWPWNSNLACGFELIYFEEHTQGFFF